MGPYTFLQVALVGFFLFAAIYHALVWLHARRDAAVLVFAAHALLCGVLSGVILLLSSATTVAAADRAWEWRTTLVALMPVSLVWLLSLTTRVRARAFVWLITAVFSAATLLSLVTPLNGRVLAIERVTVPWGETLTVVTASPGSPLTPRLVLGILTVNVFGLYAAYRMWPRDRTGAIIIALAIAPYVFYIGGILTWLQSSWPAWLYIGTAPYVVLCVLLAFQLAREQHASLVSLREAEAAMRKGEERYRLLAQNQPAILIEWMPDGEITFASAAVGRIINGPGHTAAPTVRELLTDASWTALKGAIETLAPESPVVEGEYETLADGGSRFVHLVSQGAFDGDGHLVVVQSAGGDITERRAMEAARQRLESQLTLARHLESVGQLAGGVAHDFNNLLTVINGYADILLANAPEDTRVELEQIRRAGERAASLTQQLLDFSGRSLGEVSVCDANVVIAEAERMLRRVIGSDVEMSVSLSTAPAWIRCDPAQLERALLNLAINARDAMPGGGELRMATAVRPHHWKLPREPGPEETGEAVVVSVVDTGTGMTDEVRARLFEPFYTTKGPGRGTGLGLAVVEGFVRQTLGEIQVDTALGKGTAFHLRLPHVVAPRAPTVPHRNASPSVPGAGRVLVVDDDEAVRNLVASVLRQQGYTVRVARGVDDAVRELSTEPLPNLVVTDVVMPGGGAALEQSIRRDFPDVRVLFISGYTIDEALVRGVKAGEANLLHKPFTIQALAEKVRDVLASPGGLR
jgi:PAS domain S-box-containing protein